MINQLGNRFRREVEAFAAEHGIPILHLKKPDRSPWDDRKLDHIRPYLEPSPEARWVGGGLIAEARPDPIDSLVRHARAPAETVWVFYGTQ